MWGWVVELWPSVQKYVVGAGNYVASCEENISNLVTEASELRNRREKLQEKADYIDRQGMKPPPEVQPLLDHTKKLVDEAQYMEDKFKKMTKCLGDIPLNVVLGYYFSTRAEKLLPVVRDLKSRPTFTADIHGESLPTARFVERIASGTVGAESVLEQLQRHVKDENVLVIGVHGMGGAGKTALIEELNNQLHEMKLDWVIWIDVPRDCGVQRLQQILSQRLDIEWEADAPEEQRRRRITRELNRSNFVLILDDLWKPVDLAAVGVPIAKRPSKSKVIVMTRIEEVCGKMYATKVWVKPMEWKESWKLFGDKGGTEQIGNDKDVLSLAKVLVGKCGGLPMALVNLGAEMSSKRSKHQWKKAITVMDISPWDYLGTDIFSRLKRSYDNLADERLRTCFLYCALYPEGLPLYKDWIIDYCIGEGIIADDVFSDLEQLYNSGHELLGILEAQSLLESTDQERYFKMNPVVRGLALWIASECGQKPNRWLVRPQAELTEAPPAESWSDAEKVSLLRNNISALTEIPECPNLETLLLQRNLRMEKVCDGFFRSMTRLRVLDLSHNRIQKLPSGIEVLQELRYLDVCCTNLRALPPELRELKHLRFLLLSNMPFLRAIADGVIAALGELRVLYMDYSYGHWKVGTVGNGVDFDELQQLKRLTSLALTIVTVHGLQRLVQSQRLASRTRRLHIRGCPGLTVLDMPPSMLGRSLRRLQSLYVSDSDELTEVAINGNEDVDVWSRLLPSFQTLKLHRLGNTRLVWYGGCVQNLRNLYIWNCRGMEHLIYSDDDHDEDEQVERIEEDGESPRMVIDAFPNLRELQLVGVPPLKSLHRGRRVLLSFPSLEKFKVLRCEKLNNIEMKAEQLKVIQGDQQWWEELEWEDQNIKSQFASLFKDNSVVG